MQKLDELEIFYRKALTQLTDFLTPLHGIWSQEIIGNYPKTMESYPTNWIENLAKISTSQEWSLDCERGHDFLEEGGLKVLLDKIVELKSVPRLEESLEQNLKEISYPSWALFQVTGKKQHEIKAISFFLDHKQINQNSLIDIGGGKGHLSRILALYHGYHATSIDSDRNLQELGKARLKKYPYPENHGSLNFIHHTFGEESTKPQEDALFDQASLSIGLHTCGELALSHLSRAKRGRQLLNIGCCYQRLRPGVSTNLSEFAQKHASLELTKFALTLATRGHTDISLKDYQVKKRVKYYRAALQLFTNTKRDDNEFISVGSNHPRDYFKDFSHYALPKMQALGISTTEKELNQFYASEEVQRSLDQIFRGNLVRWRLGRLIEKYLIYDRALSLVEKGHAARVFQIFDEKISPRNMAIYIDGTS